MPDYDVYDRGGGHYEARERTGYDLSDGGDSHPITSGDGCCSGWIMAIVAYAAISFIIGYLVSLGLKIDLLSAYVATIFALPVVIVGIGALIVVVGGALLLGVLILGFILEL